MNSDTVAIIDQLRDELEKTKRALRDTANGCPSEWAYVQLKNDYDILVQKLTILRRYHFGDGTITREMALTALGE